MEKKILIAQNDVKIINRPIGIIIPYKESVIETDEKIVCAWVKEMRQTDSNPVLFFKAKNEQYVGLDPQDFVLVLMTVSQKTMLTDFNYDRVCVDSIKRISESDFNLIVLIAADQYEEGVPIAFCITSIISQETLQVFYSYVKKAIPNLKPSVFMGYDAPMFYDAWEDVFDSCDECFLCAWHIDHEWQEHLVSIEGKEKQEEVHKTLKSLMYELDEDSFNEMLETFTLQLSGEDSKEFYEYFMTYYYWRSQMWAYCFRSNAKINTNMHIETFHSNLEQLCLKSKKPKSVANCIITLINIANDKKFDDFLKSQREKKIEEETNKFQGQEESEISTLDEQNIDWEIVSESGDSYHVTKNHACSEQCKVSCHKPDAYKCTCHSYVSSNSACKHINFMLQYTQENNTDPFDGANTKQLESNQEPVTLESLKAQAASILAKLNCIQYMDESVAQKVKLHLDAIERLLDPVLQKSITFSDSPKQKRSSPNKNQSISKKQRGEDF